jgi:LmbE family N-acetylglucosaminyl deacetylase
VRKNRRAVAKWTIILAAAFAGKPLGGQFPPAPGTGPGLAETVEAIDGARVATRILYVTAHPDDESAAVLTYLARGLHADVALLSLTRGEGGQNALGPEQAPQLGLIRTKELLAATRGYGVKLYFTRAKDFGFSKTPEETEKIWGQQEVLADMVRVLRTFRPNVVVNHWGGVHGGHGHHQAAGLLTPKAVALAADERAFPELRREGLSPWGGGRSEVQVLNLERFSDKPTGYLLPLDEVSPLWGKTWREIGMDAFANHRTQGVAVFFGNPFFRRPIALKREDGKPFDPGTLARTLADLSRDCGAGAACSALGEADENLKAAGKAALALDWAGASGLLGRALESVRKVLPPDSSSARTEDPLWPTLENVGRRIANARQLVDGSAVTAVSDKADLVVGETFRVRVTRRCRRGAACPKPALSVPPWMKEIEHRETPEGALESVLQIEGPPPAPAPFLNLLPEAPPLVEGGEEGAGDSRGAAFPVIHVLAGSTHVEPVPIRVVPAYTLAVEPKQAIELVAGEHKPLEVFLRVHSYSTRSAHVEVALDVPAGWKSSAPVGLDFAGEGDRYAKLTVGAPETVAPGRYPIGAHLERGGERFATSLEPLPSAPTLRWEEPAECVVNAFDLRVPSRLKVGYITAESEPVPDSLRRTGIEVDLLDAAGLNFSDLSKYDAIVVGVRAYELRGELPGANQRLLEYVSRGGTLVVQYQRDFAWDGKNYAPYPAKIDSGRPGDPLPRTTDETAPVNFLKPDDPLLSVPNKITARDFDGWVQERGLYYWTDFDARYTPLLSMHDPGEKDLNGSLVYAKYGKGTYIYTGLAFFRQLPEGVPGAYRLFVNLLSASRSE